MNYKDSQFWAILAKLRHKDQNYKCLLSYLSYGLKSNHIKNLDEKKKNENERKRKKETRPTPVSINHPSINEFFMNHTHTQTFQSRLLGSCSIFVMISYQIYLFVFTCVRKIIDKRWIVWLSSSFMKNDCIRNSIPNSINHHRRSGESHAHTKHDTHIKLRLVAVAAPQYIHACVHRTYTKFSCKNCSG